MSQTRLNPAPIGEWADILVCPTCFGALRANPNGLHCVACACIFPLVDGIPVLIAERGSFSAEDKMGEQSGSLSQLPRE